MAAYLYGYNEEPIRYANLKGVDQVLNHITEANLYARYIEEENLPPLLTPPYRDLGALLIALVAYYQALQTLQEQSNNRPYTGTKQVHTRILEQDAVSLEDTCQLLLSFYQQATNQPILITCTPCSIAGMKRRL